MTLDLCTVEDLATLLELQPVGPDTWQGIHAIDVVAWSRLYGGQVAAQALRAATLTVTDDRPPHSLHGYFLRPGRKDLPVTYEVRRDRDGRSLSSRQVTARQDGDVIFTMSASFHVAEEGGVLEPPRPLEGWHPPDDVTPRLTLVDAAEAKEAGVVDGRQLYSDRLWVRAAHPLPADPMLQACAVTYLTDLSSGFGMVTRPDIASAGASIDHALWFQRPARADAWLLLDMAPLKAGGALGVYTGNVWGPDGLVATFAQEMLIRV